MCAAVTVETVKKCGSFFGDLFLFREENPPPPSNIFERTPDHGTKHKTAIMSQSKTAQVPQRMKTTRVRSLLRRAPTVCRTYSHEARKKPLLLLTLMHHASLYRSQQRRQRRFHMRGRGDSRPPSPAKQSNGTDNPGGVLKAPSTHPAFLPYLDYALYTLPETSTHGKAQLAGIVSSRVSKSPKKQKCFLAARRNSAGRGSSVRCRAKRIRPVGVSLFGHRRQ